MRRDVFQALADPNRREILRLLANRRMTLNALAEHFAISRPAVSKQVKILSECGLVVVRQHGRERLCEARPDKLSEVSDWVEQYHQLWEQRLDRLEAFLADSQENEK
jgi:DNA-binding transcriptional ArsR family regulator